MVSDETAHLIDEEVRDIVDRNYQRARTLLETNLEQLNVMAEALIKYETLGVEQIDDIMTGRAPRPPEDWMDDDSSRGARGPEVEDKPASETGKDGQIGGPASLH
jgi:cell division protease FtsH